MKMEGLQRLPYNQIMQILEFVEFESIILFLADNNNIHERTCPESLKQQLRNIRERLELPEQEIQGTIEGVIEQYQSIGRLDNKTIRKAASNIGAWEAAIGPIETWDVSNVTDMSYLFLQNKTFNRNISAWNTANVTNMRAMFGNATAFNQRVEFDVSKVTDTAYMFYGATSFDKYPFDTSNIHNTKHMLHGTVIGRRSLFIFVSRFKQLLNFKTVNNAIANVTDMFWNTPAPIQDDHQGPIDMTEMFLDHSFHLQNPPL